MVLCGVFFFQPLYWINSTIANVTKTFYHFLLPSIFYATATSHSLSPRFLTTASNSREDAESCLATCETAGGWGEPSKRRQESSNHSAGYVRQAPPILVYSCPPLCSARQPMRSACFFLCFCARGASDISTSNH